MGTADHRSTRFEFKILRQDANGLHVECTERGVHGSAPPTRHIADADLTPEELANVVEVLALLETKYGAAHTAAEQSTDAASVHTLMRAAESAKLEKESAKLETARIEAETVEKRAELADAVAALEHVRALAAVVNADVEAKLVASNVEEKVP